MNADRTLLTDSMWAELAPLLPGQANCRGTTARDTHGFVEAVLWLGRELAPHLGHWPRVYVRFARWRDSGVWEQGLGAGSGSGSRAGSWPTTGAFPTPASGRCNSTRPASACTNTRPGLPKKRRTSHWPQPGRAHQQVAPELQGGRQRAQLVTHAGASRRLPAGRSAAGPAPGPGLRSRR